MFLSIVVCDSGDEEKQLLCYYNWVETANNWVATAINWELTANNWVEINNLSSNCQ